MIRPAVAAGAMLLVLSGVQPPTQAATWPLDTRNTGRRATASGDELAGRTIVIDPGHQLGNHNFPE
ncbi:MAG: hypothetical protein ABW075_02500, partial [Aeromicrobium sp.]